MLPDPSSSQPGFHAQMSSDVLGNATLLKHLHLLQHPSYLDSLESGGDLIFR